MGKNRLYKEMVGEDKWSNNMDEMIKHSNKLVKEFNENKIKWYDFNFSMKKGNIKKYKPLLDYISKNYYPEFLSISQLLWYEHMKGVPIPVIEFKAPCIDALDIIDDFIKQCGKLFMGGGAKPFDWTYKDPILTATKLAKIQKRHMELEKVKKKEGWKK